MAAGGDVNYKIKNKPPRWRVAASGWLLLPPPALPLLPHPFPGRPERFDVCAHIMWLAPPTVINWTG